MVIIDGDSIADRLRAERAAGFTDLSVVPINSVLAPFTVNPALCALFTGYKIDMG
jgi:hypothetical protein